MLYDDAIIKTIIRETVKHASWDSGLLSDKVKRALIDARVLDTVSSGRIAIQPKDIADLRLRAWELAGCAYGFITPNSQDQTRGGQRPAYPCDARPRCLWRAGYALF